MLPCYIKCGCGRDGRSHWNQNLADSKAQSTPTDWKRETLHRRDAQTRQQTNTHTHTQTHEPLKPLSNIKYFSLSRLAFSPCRILTIFYFHILSLSFLSYFSIKHPH